MKHAPNTTRSIEILLIEDNPGDVRLTREVLSEGKILNQLHVAIDGVQGLDYLYRREHFHEAPRPDLVLLDLNLPRKDGFEVLAAIKEDNDLKSIPVVVLTSSSADRDVLNSYELHANCYITKPVDLDQFIEVIRSIEHFWLTIVHLPTQ